jgi:thiol-disulfide isomerase/thioredoxin
MKKLVAVAMFALSGAAAALAEVPAPKPSIPTLAQLPVVTTQPYDEKADADAAVTAAFERARQNKKLVLIDLGGNWCPDCIVLANFLELPEIKAFAARHYEIVAVDVGRFDRNLQIPARFGFTGRLKGVPTILVARPDGTLVNRDTVFVATSARKMTPESLSQYLARWPEK